MHFFDLENKIILLVRSPTRAILLFAVPAIFQKAFQNNKYAYIIFWALTDKIDKPNQSMNCLLIVTLLLHSCSILGDIIF